MKVVTLIGSSTQKSDFDKWFKELSLKGYCVLSLGVFLGVEEGNHNKETPLKQALRQSHKKRVELADIICVISKADGSIGDDTLSELHYAQELGKEIVYAEQLSVNGS